MNQLYELQKQIDQADDLYYTEGKSIVADSLYDSWKLELEKLAPNDIRLTRVGAKVRETVLQKRKHQIPMGSQFKAMNEAEFRKWVATVGQDLEFHISHKMDGASGSFEYQDGRLVSAITRGDGFEGEDITANAIYFQGLPKIAKRHGVQPFTGFIRGEIVLRKDDWKQVDPDQTSNPRNLAVGISRRKDGTDSKRLTVYAFGAYDSQGRPIAKTEEEVSMQTRAMGFNVAPYVVKQVDMAWQWFNRVVEIRPELTYWADGVVVKIDDIATQRSFGITDNRPKGQIAVKFEAEGANTTIRAVELSVGHTGAIIPTAVFDPVQIGGTTVSRATLCNWDNIQALNVGIGDKVTVVKSGDIIPMVTEVITKVASGIVPEPSECPECGGPVARQTNTGGDDTSAIYCTNTVCPGRVYGKIERFVKSLNILGGGESLLRALIAEGIKDAADLFVLNRTLVANLKMNGKTRVGEKRADAFLAEIDKVSKLTLSEFLGSLGIAGLGKRRVALIQEATGGAMDTLQSWNSGKLTALAETAGIPGIASRIQKDIWANTELINKFLANGVEIVADEKAAPVKAGAYTICITGSLSKPKAYFWDLIAKAGHVATDDFSKAVTHVVAEDTNGDSSKLKKARKAGIPIWCEADLLKALEQ